METELESTIFVRNGLQLQVSELKNKLKMTDQDRSKERLVRMRSVVLVERMRNYLTRAMSVLADHRALKTVVRVREINIYTHAKGGLVISSIISKLIHSMCLCNMINDYGKPLNSKCTSSMVTLQKLTRLAQRNRRQFAN